MEDQPCTEEQRQAVALTARERRHYILWLADYLDRSDDVTLRRAAANELRQLVGEE